MLVLVGKATPHPSNGDIELFLGDFESTLARTGAFAYAWTFNPDEPAIDVLRDSVDHGSAYLYLPGPGGLSPMRMHISDFAHERSRDGLACPVDWTRHCIAQLQGRSSFGPRPHEVIHLWFLIDAVERLVPPVDVRAAFRPVFDKYRTWKQSSFAFLRD